jgi:glycosyltransferase involved in cell wall biosynthesis
VSMKYSIVIGTHNRANDLRETLQCLARLETPYPWEVIVVDNNSTDSTPAVVRELAKSFPGVLRYVFESEPGRCAALNAGIAVARGEIILTPDDDIRVDPQWLETARRGLERFNCDYVGGQVYPVWLGPRPRWIPDYTCRAWAVVALSDEGPESFEYVNKVPLGANLAFRREVFDVVGWWDTRLGRKAGTLLGQEVRDWCVRARAKGIRGVYLPELRMGHLIPVWRLRKNYFRRWFYWRGISRALIYRQSGLDMEKPEETIFDFRHSTLLVPERPPPRWPDGPCRAAPRYRCNVRRGAVAVDVPRHRSPAVARSQAAIRVDNALDGNSSAGERATAAGGRGALTARPDIAAVVATDRVSRYGLRRRACHPS